jgi:hypothetical protein
LGMKQGLESQIRTQRQGDLGYNSYLTLKVKYLQLAPDFVKGRKVQKINDH